MAGKQIDFPPEQKHVARLDLALWIVAIACIVLVLLAIQFVGGGGL
jgi:hypothetical protein